MAHHIAPIIGYHRAPLSQKFGAPRQPNLVALVSIIEMLAPYDTPLAFEGLATFSHLWVSWQFHHNDINKASQSTSADVRSDAINSDTNSAVSETKFRAQVRPPRLGGNQKIGVFASRSMYRPSGLGLSVVKLERVDVIEGRVLLIISGADMIDGTPIIDIKPYIAYSDACVEADSGFAPTAPTVLKVTMTELAHCQFIEMVNTTEKSSTNIKAVKDKHSTVATLIYRIQNQLIASDIDYIIDLIAQDPRPAYRRQECSRVFVMRYKSVDVSFCQVESGKLEITSIKAIH